LLAIIIRSLFHTITNNKLFYAILFTLSLLLLVPVIQVEIALGSNLQITTTNNSKIVNDDDNVSTNNSLKIQSNKNIINYDKNNDSPDNNRLSLGPDRTVDEGTNLTLVGIISNAISIPANSVVYSWKQIDGPKIDLKEEDKQKKILRFAAPNRPNDTKYIFELNAIQKKGNENINLGTDSINILVVDINKVAKSASMNIPSMPSSSPSLSSSSSSSPPNFPNNNEGNGDGGSNG
jgi:hypothetical protein